MGQEGLNGLRGAQDRCEVRHGLTTLRGEAAVLAGYAGQRRGSAHLFSWLGPAAIALPARWQEGARGKKSSAWQRRTKKSVGGAGVGGNNWARRLCPEELIFRAALTALRVQRSRARRYSGLDAAMDRGGGQRLWMGDAVIGAASTVGAKD